MSSVKKFLFALLLGGCVMTPEAARQIPASLAGEWVTRDFETPDNEAEPTAGNVIYIDEGGLATLYSAPIANVWLRTTYQPVKQTVVFKTIVIPAEDSPVVTLCYRFDPKAETLTLIESNPPQPPTDLKGNGNTVFLFKRRRAQVPGFVHKMFAEVKAHGLPNH